MNELLMTKKAMSLNFKILLRVLGLCCLVVFNSCKSDVKDKTPEQAQNVLTVERLNIENRQTIRETNAVSAVITKKYYSVKACLTENALGQKMDRRKVQVSGHALRSNMTDTSGCIFWDHTFDLITQA